MSVADRICDEIVASVLIVGAGPAGLAAAAAAAPNAKNVLILDENSEAGGQIWRRGVDPSNTQGWALYSQLVAQPHVQWLSGSRIIAVIANNRLLVETPDGPRIIQWQKMILCTGARELILPFPGWTLPGVTGAGGLQALIKSGANLKGRRVVIAGTGPLLLSVAASVKQAQGKVVAVVEYRSAAALRQFFYALLSGHQQKLWQAVGLLWAMKPWRYRLSSVVSAAQGISEVTSVIIQKGDKSEEIACDLLACGFGLRTNLELATLLRCQLRDGAIAVDEQQRTSQQNIWAAGEVTGIGGVDKALIEGRIAGLDATGYRATDKEAKLREKAWMFTGTLQKTFNLDVRLRQLCQADTLVCRCEDVPARELEKFADWRTAKLMTRVGMGACQGRICGVACEFLYDWQTPEARQPVFPAKASSLALLADLPPDTSLHG